ncbi:hypothetical protein E1A17_24570 [Salmonella enterica subsp. enterica serovar Newport]|nr:hypothetical protein [Salmonella enterica subsp. enterica serovar Newport]
MEQEPPKKDSLYDFLYLDEVRVKSLIAQLNDSGVLNSLTETSTTDSGSVKNAKIGFSTIALAQGNYQSSSSIQNKSEKNHDTRWTHPLILLDLLQQEDFTSRGLKDATLGKCVLISGSIRFYDMDYVSHALPVIADYCKNLWNVPAKNKKRIDDAPMPGFGGHTIGQAKNILGFLPKSLQINFTDTESNKIWMSINKDFMGINIDDILLKYGHHIPGKWHVIGIIDALPDILQPPSEEEIIAEDDIRSFIIEISTTIRDLVGRKSDSYGLTPIMIFREVSR